MGFKIGGGIGGSKSRSSGSQNNSLDPWAQQQYSDLSGKVQGLLSGNPAQAYGGQLTASPNALQTQAGEAAKGVLDYKPSTVSTKSFADADLSKYLDPNTDAVVNAALADVERSRQQQRVNDAQGATAAGAWGGSRHGVADALTNEAADRTAASTAANLRSQAFDRAANLWSQDAARDLTAQTTNANLGLSGAQLGLQGAGLLGQLGSTLYSQEQGGLDRQYADFLRLEQDPKERAQLLLGLLGNTPMFYDTKTSGKNSGTNWNLSGGVEGKL